MEKNDLEQPVINKRALKREFINGTWTIPLSILAALPAIYNLIYAISYRMCRDYYTFISWCSTMVISLLMVIMAIILLST